MSSSVLNCGRELIGSQASVAVRGTRRLQAGGRLAARGGRDRH
jgi:hypothetical protein